MHHMKDPRLAEAYCDRMYDAEAFKQNGKRGQHRPSWSAPMRQPSYDMYLSLIQACPLPCTALAVVVKQCKPRVSSHHASACNQSDVSCTDVA